MLFKQRLIVLLRYGQCRCDHGPFVQVEFLAWRHMAGLGIDSHSVPSMLRWLLRNLLLGRMVAACLSFHFKPVLVCLTLSVDSLLVEFIGPRDDLGGAIDRLLFEQGVFCRIEDPMTSHSAWYSGASQKRARRQIIASFGGPFGRGKCPAMSYGQRWRGHRGTSLGQVESPDTGDRATFYFEMTS